MPIARGLAGRFRCILPDLRNHGGSPWSGPFDYRDMAGDVLELADSLGIGRLRVLGHSMGAKTAMTCALEAPGRIEAVAAADMAPRAYEGDFLSRIIDTLLGADLSKAGSRSDADRILAENIPQAHIRAFLLKSLGDENGSLSWRLNLPVLRESFGDLSGWAEDGKTFAGPALFLRGENSPYITGGDEIVIRGFFPSARVVTVPGAGHWIHADNPVFVIHSIEEFFTWP